jgi:hypothetical protein
MDHDASAQALHTTHAVAIALLRLPGICCNLITIQTARQDKCKASHQMQRKMKPTANYIISSIKFPKSVIARHDMINNPGTQVQSRLI